MGKTVLFYFVPQIFPILAAGSWPSHPFERPLLLQGLFTTLWALPSTTSNFWLSVFPASPRSNHFSKEPWFIFIGGWPLGAKMWMLSDLCLIMSNMEPLENFNLHMWLMYFYRTRVLISSILKMPSLNPTFSQNLWPNFLPFPTQLLKTTVSSDCLYFLLTCYIPPCSLSPMLVHRYGFLQRHQESPNIPQAFPAEAGFHGTAGHTFSVGKLWLPWSLLLAHPPSSLIISTFLWQPCLSCFLNSAVPSSDLLPVG